jgi:quercetin dioxygenase-like cupin family protein
MSDSATVTRRVFNGTSFFALAAAALIDETVFTQQSGGVSERRDVIKQRLPGEPPREITVIEVTYAPGEGSPPHHHPHGVVAFVVSGAIVSKVGEEPERTFRAGEAWWEPLGANHRISRNASRTEPAKLLAIYIAPAGATPADLMKPD